jgi:hypothetical protein
MGLIMYDMYPDSWTDDQSARQPRRSSAQPRRRVRKEHSVVPPVIAHQLQTTKESAGEG